MAAVRPLLAPCIVLAGSTLGRPIEVATLLVAQLQLASFPQLLVNITRSDVEGRCSGKPVSWQLLPLCDGF